MPYRRDVQGKGGAILSYGASISGNSGASMVPDHQPTVGQATGSGGPHALGSHDDSGVGGTRDGVQRQRHCGGQPVSGSRILSEAASRLACLRRSVDASRIAYRLHVLEETLHSNIGLRPIAARYGAGAVFGLIGQGSAAMVAAGTYLSAAGGNGQACGGHLSGGVSEQKGRQDHIVSRWPASGPYRDRVAERTRAARTGSWDGCGARTGDNRNVFSRRGTFLSPLGVRLYVRFQPCWCWFLVPVIDANGS